METMIPENVLVTPRGVQIKKIPFGSYTVEVKVRVKTNKEIDDLAVKHVTYEDDMAIPDAKAITNEAIITGLLDINTTFNGKRYPDLDEDERDDFLDTMDSKLRDSIAKAVLGVNHVMGKERDFL